MVNQGNNVGNVKHVSYTLHKSKVQLIGNNTISIFCHSIRWQSQTKYEQIRFNY